MAKFIIVKHGDDEEFLANPDCKQRVLLTYIREKCNFKGEGPLDLMHTGGSLARIRLLDQNESLVDVLETRGTYVPIAMEVNPDNPIQVRSAVPLLTDWQKKYPRFESTQSAGTLSILTSDSKMKCVVKGVFDSRRSEIGNRLSSLVIGRTFVENKPARGKRRKKLARD